MSWPDLKTEGKPTVESALADFHERGSTVLETDCLAPTRGPGDFSSDHFPGSPPVKCCWGAQ
jgi:hypothetical protein